MEAQESAPIKIQTGDIKSSHKGFSGDLWLATGNTTHGEHQLSLLQSTETLLRLNVRPLYDQLPTARSETGTVHISGGSSGQKGLQYRYTSYSGLCIPGQS